MPPLPDCPDVLSEAPQAFRLADIRGLVVPDGAGPLPVFRFRVPPGRNVVYSSFEFIGIASPSTPLQQIASALWSVARDDAGVLGFVFIGAPPGFAIVIIDPDTVELQLDNTTGEDVALFLVPVIWPFQLEDTVL